MSTQPPTSARPPSPPSGMDHDALPPGTRFGEFEIRRVVGVGGFGIVYLAHDHSLEREVALKEYMPASLAARGQGPQITVRSSSFAETYAIGLRSFVNEARLLARFDHPSLVKVYRFWEDNATAYMVMPFLQGTTLRDTRRAMAHPPNEAWVRSVIAPILSALELLHREGVYHRDIAPDNILLPPDGPPVLLDFGAARRVISDRTQSLTAILKPSYAPIEQYAEMAQMRQGPWTDLYALGAVIHYLLFGAPPAPATARAVQDETDAIEHRIVPGVSPLFLEALAWMLAIRPNQRPQSGEELRAVLDGRAQIPPRGRPGITLPGALASAAAVPVDDRTRVTAVPTRPPVVTAHMPTHQPTAPMGPSAHAQAPTTFGPTTHMPTARQATEMPGARGPATVPPTGAQTLPPTRPQTVPPPQRPTVPPPRAQTVPPPTRHDPGPASRAPPLTPPTRPAPLAAAGAGSGASAAAPARSKLPLALGAGAVVLALAVVVGWQLMSRRDTTADGAAAAASSPAVASASAAAAVPAPIAVPLPVVVPPATVTVAPPVAMPAPAPVAPPVVVAASSPVVVQASAPMRTVPPALASASAAGSAVARVVRPPRSASDAATGSATAGANRPGDTSAGGAGTTSPGYGTAGTAQAQAAAAERARVAQAAAAARDAALRPAPVAVEAGPASVREACGKRVFIALAVCMDERCEEPRWRNTQECVGILARKAQRENR